MSNPTLWIPVVSLCVCWALGLSACSNDTVVVGGPDIMVAPSAPVIEPSADSTPPRFGGLRSVRLVGYELYRLAWEPASDDRTDSSAIRYQVHHIVEPYRELDGSVEAILTTEPGVLEVTFANEAPPGRFYVRALDEAGNASAVVSGLAQRSRRPWVRAADGTLAARITDCAQIEPGRGVCVGEEGYAAIWQRDRWETLDTGTTATLRIARGPSDTFLFSDLGHLFRLVGDRAELVDLVFDTPEPILPFRQFASDHLGLRYWIDGTGRVFIGADRQFRGALHPLALPERDACPSLRGVAFGEVASFALCDDGAAYSVSHRQPGMRWLSLTPNADFALPFGLTRVLAESDTEGVLVDPTGIRDVGVGGWTPRLLVDWHVLGVHPMDVPDDPPTIGRIGDAWYDEDEDLVVVTDTGLYKKRRGDWELLSGSGGPLVGALEPTLLEPSDRLTLIYEDGAVATLRRGRRAWLTRRQLTGFTLAFETIEGSPLAVVRGSSAGVYAWHGERWERVARGLPGDEDPSVTVAGLAGSALEGQTLIAYGSVGAVGAIWRLDDGRWERAGPIYAPPPEPVIEEDLIVPEDAELEMAFELEPPPPMRGVSADALPAPPPTMEPIVDVAVDARGRAVAAGEHQVWWRLPDSGWLYLGRRPGAISRVALDAGETYIVLEDGGVVRCWRDQCGDPVAPTSDAPAEIVWSWRLGAELVVVDTSGSTLSFVPATAVVTEGDPMIDPAVETRPGAWRELGPPLAATMVASVRMRRVTETLDVIWTWSGEMLERQGDRWRLEAIDESAIALFSTPSGWTMLNSRGLFALGPVREVVRESPEP